VCLHYSNWRQGEYLDARDMKCSKQSTLQQSRRCCLCICQLLLRTNSTKHSPSWEVRKPSAGQEIPRMLRNLSSYSSFTSDGQLPLSWDRKALGCSLYRLWYFEGLLTGIIWLRCCATNRKVAGSIPDGVIWIFHWHYPPDRTMALGSTQPLTEMSTRRISWG